MTNRFVMVGLPRTGSTLLRELLSQHPDVLMHSELFHPLVAERSGTHAILESDQTIFYEDESEDALAFLHRVAWNEQNSARYQAIGFKLFARFVQSPGTARLFARLREDLNDVRVIHLVRDNLLDVWVSVKLAERSGVWRIDACGDRSRFDSTEPFNSDPWEMKEFFEFCTSMNSFFRRHFRDGPFLEINYDHLTGATSSTMMKVFEFLGAEPITLDIPLQKQNKRTHSETLLNFNELKAFFADTPYSSFFDGIEPSEVPPSPPADTGSNSGQSFDDLKSAANALSTSRWIEAFGMSLEAQSPQHLFGVPMPTAPTPEFQKIFVGASGIATAEEGGRFYQYVLQSLKKHGVGEVGRLLDFGCSWGRVARLMLREVPQTGIYGIDPNRWAIESCRQHIPQACFIQSSTFPPLPFRDQFFDVVVAYSVFSHLPELTAHAWICEISRILRPGGLLIATTHPLWILDMVRKLRDRELPVNSAWHQGLVNAWQDIDITTQKYHEGEFLYAATNPGEAHYGEAIIPPNYVSKAWSNIMQPVEFFADPEALPEAAFILKKLSP